MLVILIKTTKTNYFKKQKKFFQSSKILSKEYNLNKNYIVCLKNSQHILRKLVLLVPGTFESHPFL